MKKLNFNNINSYYEENKSIINPILILIGLLIFVYIVFFRYKERAVRYAKRFLGKEETGNNLGFYDKNFENLMKKAGWRSGNQWCAFFTKMVWQNSLSPKHRKAAQKIMTGSTQLNFARFKKYGKGLFKISDKPKKGGLVIWQSKSKPAHGHTGIIAKVNPITKEYETIEGNSNKGGSEGIVTKHRYSKGGSPAGMRLKGFIIPV